MQGAVNVVVHVVTREPKPSTVCIQVNPTKQHQRQIAPNLGEHVPPATKYTYVVPDNRTPDHVRA